MWFFVGFCCCTFLTGSLEASDKGTVFPPFSFDLLHIRPFTLRTREEEKTKATPSTVSLRPCLRLFSCPGSQDPHFSDTVDLQEVQKPSHPRISGTPNPLPWTRTHYLVRKLPLHVSRDVPLSLNVLSFSLSYADHSPYLPVCCLLTRFAHVPCYIVGQPYVTSCPFFPPPLPFPKPFLRSSSSVS